MSERDEIIHEVRKLIKEGTTISKCLRTISKKLKVSNLGAVDVLRAAFCLSLREINKATGGYKQPDANNTQSGLATFLVLPMIVQKREEWDEAVTQEFDNWFESLSCSSSESIERQALATIEGDAAWATVPTAVREQYLTAERSRLVLSEYGEIISRLAERLQLRIDELDTEEKRLSSSINTYGGT